jgi:glycosyltransferase involved in cell wall biosynthesis
MKSPIEVSVSKTNLLVLIPAYNESLNIESVLRDIDLHGYNALVINDGSTDDTSAKAKRFHVPVLDLPYNLGVGGALRAGFQYAIRNGFYAVVQIDADGQHPVDHIDDLILAANNTNAHLVLGSRFLDGGDSMELSLVRRVTMKILAKSASKATTTRITDSTSGFRLIRTPLLDKFASNFASNYLGDTYEALIAAGRAGYKIHEIPAPITERLNGVSSSSSLNSTGQTLKVLIVALLKLHTKI